MEAAGQLILNVSIILISGFQDKVLFIDGDVQMLTLSLSFISLAKTNGGFCFCHTFSVQLKFINISGEMHFFMRTATFKHEFVEIAIASITFIPEVSFRVTGLAITMTHLRWFSLLPLLSIVVLNYIGTGKAGLTSQKDDNVTTSIISVVCPTCYSDDPALAMPTFQKFYYPWNRNVLAAVLFLCVGLVTFMVNTEFVDQFDWFCHIHSMPDCPATLYLSVYQFNTILLPVFISTGLLTVIPQFCDPSAWINRPLKYQEKIVRTAKGRYKRV